LRRSRKKLKPYKVSRGSFEEQKLKEDKKAETQRALLFILPVLMIAVLAIGIFFGYKSYEKSEKDKKLIVSQTTEPEQIENDPMLLTVVSPAYPLDESFVPKLTEVDGVEVAEKMADSLEEMLADAEKAGCGLKLVEGYISFEEQKTRYEKMVETYRKDKKASLVMAEVQVRRTIPPAGESEQQTGLLVDLSVKTDGKFADTPAYAWLMRYSVDYGFVLRYPDKENAGGMEYSSHLFRYIGRTHAYKMRELDMDFDEYLAYLAAQ
jgi:D-alanyl-D-alanine carboxypeptidase